ncbi:MAG: thermonuclease family protein [Rhodospirillaceae bacterium]|nr:thermonuclease family protein [Rhodospirillaceae bacterium]
MKIKTDIKIPTAVFLFAVALYSAPGTSVQAEKALEFDSHLIDVIDGDTIQVGATIYQLAGIDAPELGQVCNHSGHLWLCGLSAGYSLKKHLQMEVQPIRCFIRPNEKRPAEATCISSDQEISDILLKAGHVMAGEDVPPHYVAMEHMAQQAGLGIWGGSIVQPWEWRKGKRLDSEADFKGSSHPTDALPWVGLEQTFLQGRPPGLPACMVKGTIDGQGRHIYLVPFDDDYEARTIDTSTGERFFCSDENARKAGWTRLEKNP